MPKVHKVYPPFFNGVSEQSPELILDNQCKEMNNCVPDIVVGLTKRPPAVTQKTYDFATYPEFTTATIFHTYDRGEDNEEYLFVESNTPAHPVHIFNLAGEEQVVEYDVTNEAAIKTYLAQSGLRALTVQDRSWVYSKNASVNLDYTTTSPTNATYKREAFYWLKRGSGDRYSPINYAVYLDGVSTALDPTNPSNGTANPPNGSEDSDVAAARLGVKINALTDFQAVIKGSLIKITRIDGADFTFSSWDSWGNQASESWKGSVGKISDLPKEMPFDNVHVKVEGVEANSLTDYFVTWNGLSWQETLDPEADRGTLINMPVSLDRISLVAGLATFSFNLIPWSQPLAGTLENNPNPTFAPSTIGVQHEIRDMFFYKNRLGLTSDDSIVLSEAGNYTNFYATTTITAVDSDVIDVTVSTNQANKIHFTKPFNNSLYIFTKYAQYELVSEGTFSSSNVSISNATNYPMNTGVEPIVVNDSLYFISTTNNRQQLREYIKTEKLNVKGIDLNISTPTYLTEPIKRIVVDGVLGYVVCTTDTDTVYLYNYKEDGESRIQTSWSKWKFFNGLTTAANSFQYFSLSSNLLVWCKTALDYRYHKLQLDYNTPNGRHDVSTADNITNTQYSYVSSVVMPDYYPLVSAIRSPKHKMLLKKVTIEGVGDFDADVYRKDYNRTFTKTHTGSLKDLDLHIASKVGNVDITIKDSSSNDFKITSIIVEGMLTVTSKEIK